METQNKWKDIKGLEGKYQVSTNGEVCSLSRYITEKTGKKYWKEGRILIQSKHNHGYMVVALGSNRRAYVHRLVAETFIDNPEGKPLVNHINGNKSDNRVLNIEWATAHENCSHAYKTGLRIPHDRRGEKNSRYKHGKKILLNINDNCLVCGKEFVKQYQKSICCSRSCNTRYFNNQRRLNKNM